MWTQQFWSLVSVLSLLLSSCERCCVLGAEATHDEEKLIGWRGETYSVDEASMSLLPWVETVAHNPRVLIYHNFLSRKEARTLRALAAPTMRQSAVVGRNGSGTVNSIRTSFGTFLPRLSHQVVKMVAQRVAEWVAVPPIHQESIQVLRYSPGQWYGAHFDSLIDDSPRMCTVLLYLSDVEEGGETAFPEGSTWLSPLHEAAAGPLSECAAGHVAFRPKLGDALLFFSVHPDGTHDPAAKHAGCPVIKGVKWTATLWVHSMPFQPSSYRTPQPGEANLDPGWCEDVTATCTEWAASGECEKNPVFMVGTDGGVGKCRQACKACMPCRRDSNDIECYRRNRRDAGFLIYEDNELLM